MRTINDLSVPKKVTLTVDGFDGYSENGRSDGKTVLRAENISFDRFPSISPRARRALLGYYGNVTALLFDEHTVRIENGRFVKDESVVSDEYFSEYVKPTLLRLGDYFIVMPFGMYFNVNDDTDYGTVRKSYIMGESGTEISTVDKDLSVITEYTVMRTRPAGAMEGDLWASPRAEGGYEMMRFDGYEWRPYESYVKLKSSSLSSMFKVGDILECKGADNVLSSYIKVCRKDEDGIYFEGAAPQIEKINNFSIQRPMPLMQQSTVCGGRMVGVYCGRDEDGNYVSRAYASKVNDPLCWSEVGGAFTADLGGNETFNAIIGCRGDVYAFRENSIVRLKLSDDRFSFSSTDCEGVKAGMGGSVACIDGTVYYKSPSAVCAYDGSYPKRIASSLGADVLSYVGESVGGAYNGKYYLRLADKKERSNIYVYDIVSKGWSIEDDPGVTEFVRDGDALVAICNEGNGSAFVLWDYDRAGGETVKRFANEGYPIVEKNVKWSFETGKTESDIKKRLAPTRIFLKARLSPGASLSAGCIYNGRSAPDRIVSLGDNINGYFELPCPVTGCDAVRLLVFGRGDAEVMGYAIEYGPEEA